MGQQSWQERDKLKSPEGPEGGREDLCFPSSKKLQFIERNWPTADYSIAGPLSKGSGCITELCINALVMDALCCGQDPLPKLTGIPLEAGWEMRSFKI